MSRHKATKLHRARSGEHRATSPRRARGIVGVAVLATGVLIAAPVVAMTGDQYVPREEPVAAPSGAPSSATPPVKQPDGEIEVNRQPRTRAQPSTRIPERGTGAFEIAPAPRADTDGATTYRVEVEKGLPFAPRSVARFVEATLADGRGWAAHHRLARVDDHADLRIVLATPETADALCAPLDTGGRLSCRNGTDVVLNAWRWNFGADSYAGDLEAYRRYVVNHETGHALGYPHVACPASGEPAPVMLQQTKGLDGCQANPWPALVDLVGH